MRGGHCAGLDPTTTRPKAYRLHAVAQLVHQRGNAARCVEFDPLVDGYYALVQVRFNVTTCLQKWPKQFTADAAEPHRGAIVSL